MAGRPRVLGGGQQALVVTHDDAPSAELERWGEVDGVEGANMMGGFGDSQNRVADGDELRGFTVDRRQPRDGVPVLRDDVGLAGLDVGQRLRRVLAKLRDGDRLHGAIVGLTTGRISGEGAVAVADPGLCGEIEPERRLWRWVLGREGRKSRKTYIFRFSACYRRPMILLGFTVRNHRSLRDEATIDFTRPSLKTLLPKDGDWGSAVHSIAGVFGGNATGKSAILHALVYAFSAIRDSATIWQGARSMVRDPFLLERSSQEGASAYEIHVVHEGVRYSYGFEVDQEGIRREWLRDVPTSRWRTLLDRDRSKGTVTFHPSLRGRIDVTPRELVLSRALLLPETALFGFARGLVESFDVVLVKDAERAARLAALADSLAEGEATFADLEALLRVADIGIEKVDIEESRVPERVWRVLLRARRELSRPDDEPGEEADAEPKGMLDELDDSERKLVVRNLLFTHRGADGDSMPFRIENESDGTIAWLAIAVPALERLRNGGLLLIDEIDASLHPHLVEVLLGAFADPEINVRQAQLLFTSHESYILSPLSEVQLAPEQVWLTDKTREGVTEVTCLADFPRHPDANVAKRYLTGRYGGIPRLTPSVLAALVVSGAELG